MLNWCTPISGEGLKPLGFNCSFIYMIQMHMYAFSHSRKHNGLCHVILSTVPSSIFIHMYSWLAGTHPNDSGINDCVQSPSSKPCIIMRANTATDIRTKILQWYGVPNGWVLVEAEHMIRVCRRDLKAASIRQLTVKWHTIANGDG